ncbi:MAG: aminodeoxychorismate synthase component I [Deltaproteobacteria bacterium]|nr:aminodeoxychorismate synthase component I [Deltaproteobacteria bacterium]
MALPPSEMHTAVVAKPVPIDGEPAAAWREIVHSLSPGQRWWLDSAQAGPPLGRWSFAGAHPYATLRCFGEIGELDVHRRVRPDWPGVGRHRHVGPVLEWLAELAPPPPQKPLEIPFSAGAVGVFGYELAEQLERVGLPGQDDLGLPDVCLQWVDQVWAFDHLEGRLWAVGCGFDRDPARAGERANEAAGLLRAAAEAKPECLPRRSRAGQEPAHVPGPSHDADAYAKAIDFLLERIEAGDLYQACLTRRESHTLEGSPWQMYLRLRKYNPAPFGAFLELPDVVVLGSSPERFLQVKRDGWVESRPIKGTRPRGADPRADRALRTELTNSPKDRAENLMIVDLVRNDLGRVCEFGSIHVPELMAVEAYASVFQMVSTVRGRLAPGRAALDAFAAAFPPGSMTGAPKIAAMNLLAGLEPVRRGFYAGALGYLDVTGACDFSVVIRTGFAKGGLLHLHAGGAIVADSNAAEEWKETTDKTRPLLSALVEGDACAE